MAQPFSLKISDGLETVNFIGTNADLTVDGYKYNVADGGFDIGLPSVKRELVAQRPGFYIPVVNYYEYRESHITFTVTGNTRSDVIKGINRIERIFRRVAARVRLFAGRRAELSYSWEGSSQISYFEAFSGDVSFPTDALSVAKVHRMENGKYTLPECELTVYLSGSGYGVSINSDTLTDVPLKNSVQVTKTTAGVPVQNPGSGQCNYVEIAGSDLPGSQPLITRLLIDSDTPYSAWEMMYIGHQVEPYPSVIVFDSIDVTYDPGWVAGAVNPADANRGHYLTTTFGNTDPWYQANAGVKWSLSNSTLGMFYAIYHGFDSIPATYHIGVGIEDFTAFGIQYVNDRVNPISSTRRALPLGVIQLPPAGVGLGDLGTIDPNLSLALFLSGEGTPGTISLDYVSLLPMASGLRILRAKSSNLTGTMIDDGWKGIEYMKTAGGVVSTPFFGLMQPIKLEAGVNQRLYFVTTGGQDAKTERQRKIKIRVQIVPTYLTLAM
jgi:hypothetical protein